MDVMNLMEQVLRGRVKSSLRRGNGSESDARDLGAMWSETVRRDLEFVLII